MIEYNPSLFKTVPMEHQHDSVKLILGKDNWALFDEMGVGKSKPVVDAACILYEAGVIDTVVVCCPAQAKITWLHEELGEIVSHCWKPSYVVEYTSGSTHVPHFFDKLLWVVVSYEFGRSEIYKNALAGELEGRKIMMVADEASRLKNRKALQTRVFVELKQKYALRGGLLDGTPLSNRNILDLYAKFAFLDKGILGFKNYTQFQHHHATMGGFNGKQALEYHNVEELNKKINPYILRREKKDVLKHLKPKMFELMTVPLSPESWKLYKQMRDEMLVQLNDDERSFAQHATTKTIRLQQITSGFLGGVEDAPDVELDEDWFALETHNDLDIVAQCEPKRLTIIGEEKTATVIRFLCEQREQYGFARHFLWCRFTAEIQRFTRLLEAEGFPVFHVVGGQAKHSRNTTIEQFGRFGDRQGNAIGVGQQAAGSLSLNFVSCSNVHYVSNSYSMIDRTQSEDRFHRQGQVDQVLYWDWIATGPKGQRTIDMAVVESLRKMRDVATWTTDQWRKALEIE